MELNSNDISKCLEYKNYKIINIIKCINYKFDNTGELKSFWTEKVSKLDITRFLDELSKILLNDEYDGLCLIIFTEFFFSYRMIIDDDDYELILDSLKKITKKKRNFVFLLTELISLIN